jgi:hypothetical protein
VWGAYWLGGMVKRALDAQSAVVQDVERLSKIKQEVIDFFGPQAVLQREQAYKEILLQRERTYQEQLDRDRKLRCGKTTCPRCGKRWLLR